MTLDVGVHGKKRGRGKRRLWPRWAKPRVVVALLILLTYSGWRYGWPPRSWETTVCPLEEVQWQEAARLAPECISPGSVGDGSRNVLLAPGSLDQSRNPVFDLEHASYVDAEVIRWK